jgi:hypothetical protein
VFVNYIISSILIIRAATISEGRRISSNGAVSIVGSFPDPLYSRSVMIRGRSIHHPQISQGIR